MFRLRDVRLRPKLIMLFLIVGVIPLAVVGIWSANRSTAALMDKSYDQLINVRDIKRAQLQGFFEERHSDLEVVVETVANLEENAFDRLRVSHELKRAETQRYFDERLGDVRALAGNMAVANAAQLASYGAIAAQHGQWFTDYTSVYGYYDLFIITNGGSVVYTVAGESDLGANLVTGPLAESPLGRAFSRAQDAAVIQDFEPYTPSGGEPASFVAAPITAGGRRIGVVALQIPTEPINEILQNREGMGVSGETYLAGWNDGRMEFRSDMLTMGDGAYVVGYDLTASAPAYWREAFAGNSGEDVFADSSGKLVMTVFDPVQIAGLNWIIVTKMDLEEAIVPRLEGESDDFFHHYIARYGYYDLFLINPNGHVFYTVTREADYNTNMVNGQYKDSGLGVLTREVLQSQAFGLADFAPYAPSNGAPAAFIALPHVENGDAEIVVALQVSLESINAIMQERSGMGETGETYLVGEDLLMRSDSYLDPVNHSVAASFANPGRGSVDTEAAREALAGATDSRLITDYNGNRVLSAFTRVDLPGTTAHWALLAEVDEAEIRAPITTLIISIVVAGALIAALVAVMAVLVAGSIARPLTAGVGFAENVAAGDLTASINVQQRDEVGMLAGALTEMVGELQRIVAQVKSASDNVAAGSEELSSSAQEMSQGATEQAASAEEVSSSMEQMSSNIKQNAENAQQTEQIALRVAQDADESGKAVRASLDAMRTIAERIEIVQEIASQTNLLALNAAIEAARAGEQGKGFAVVAAEVRRLAERSQKAAAEISELSADTLKTSEDAGNRLEELVPEIRKTAELIQEINASSQEQNSGADQINKAITQLDQVIQQNASASEEMASTSEELASQAQQLIAAMSFFSTNGSRKLLTAGDPPTAAATHETAQPKPRPQPAAPAAHRTEENHESGPTTRMTVVQDAPGPKLDLDDDDGAFEEF